MSDVMQENITNEGDNMSTLELALNMLAETLEG